MLGALNFDFQWFAGFQIVSQADALATDSQRYQPGTQLFSLQQGFLPRSMMDDKTRAGLRQIGIDGLSYCRLIEHGLAAAWTVP